MVVSAPAGLPATGSDTCWCVCFPRPLRLPGAVGTMVTGVPAGEPSKKQRPLPAPGPRGVVGGQPRPPTFGAGRELRIRQSLEAIVQPPGSSSSTQPAGICPQRAWPKWVSS